TEDAATGFPTTLGAYDTTHNGRWDAFVAKLDASGGTLLYSTFLGGSGYDPAYGIAIDASGAAYVTGQTFDDVTDFPTTPGAYDTTDNGGGDVFVAKLTLVPGTMPVLSPTGEPNYGTDGLDPEAGTMASLYVYRVEYSDADDDLPAGGDPKVHIRKGGIDVAGSPFAMTDVDPFDADVTNGKWYAYATPLASRGTDYDYDFTATDATGLAAMNWPAPPADAPDVLNAAPTADAGLDLSAFKNVLVVLDGRLSFDPDGDTLTHAWTAPPGITLSDANVPMPTFTATRSGTFPFILTVDDGDPANGTDTDTVVITVWGLPPVADLTADRTRANVGGAFLFSGAGSTDADGTIAAYLFEFADGTDQLGGSDTATHAYAAPGSYVVRLTVWDDDGNASATDTLTVTVNAPPVASGTVTPASGTLATAFTFTSTSTDSDGTIVTTTWDFGDGATESGTAVTHAYATRQTFTVTLTVWDDDGATATTTLSVTVGNLPPTAVLAVTPDGGEVGTVFTFDGSASTDDGTIIVYAWDFGDGTTGSGVVVTHRYTRNGTFVATLTVTDDGGLDGTAIVSIAVTPALGDTTPGDGANDGTIVGIIVVIITATILVLWRLRFVWFPYFIMWCYTRLRRDEILDNFARGEINGYVRLNPGDSYVEIKRNLGVAAGPLTYHLAVLEREGLVRSVLRGSRKLFYPLDVRIPENGGGLNAIQERTLRMLREEPGMTVSDIADNLGVSRYVALYHVRKLVRADLARLDRRMARLRAYPVLAIAP
ncbi:MAG TPA: PKD domain-containing protein, partial [Thermoplasmata archaeon]|nr:PKD domain-containing protein [Thermoplasmata archaeon]